MKTKLPTPQLLPSGQYRCQVMVAGKRISVVEADPDMCQAKAIALKTGMIDKQEERRKSLSLQDAIDQYIELKEPVLSPSTVRGYSTIKRHRFQAIMSQNIYTLEKSDIQRAVNLEAKKVSAKTVSNAYGLIRPVLKEYGVDAFGVKLPQRIKPIKRYLQPDDLGKLIQASEGDSCEVPILIAAWLGMRRSEIIGLWWDCVDFDRGAITVRRTVVPDKENKWILKDGAKNESSQRTISCPDYIMKKLKELYTPEANGQIFKIHPDTLRRHIHKVCQRAGITDTTVHGLRHTNAAVMKSLGIDDGHAMERGGWTNETTYKKTYSYVFDQAAQEGDAKINDYLEKLHTNLHTQ